MEGIGFAILPYYCVYEEIESGEIKMIADFKGIKDGYQAVIIQDKKSNDEINKFIKLLKENKLKY